MYLIRLYNSLSETLSRTPQQYKDWNTGQYQKLHSDEPDTLYFRRYTETLPSNFGLRDLYGRGRRLILFHYLFYMSDRTVPSKGGEAVLHPSHQCSV